MAFEAHRCRQCLWLVTVLALLAAGEDREAPCSLPRLNVQLPGEAEKFARDFHGKEAVVLDGAMDGWPGLDWSFDDWKQLLGNMTLPRRRMSVVASVGAVHASEDVHGADFLNAERSSGEDAWVAFSTSTKDEVVRELDTLGVRKVPPILARVNMHPVVSVGTCGEGLAYHQHAEAWLAIVHGAKQWYLRRPDKTPESATRRVASELLSVESGAFHCKQLPGEIVYFPDDWWHATYNVDCQASSLTVGVGGLGASAELFPMLERGDVAGIEQHVKHDPTALTWFRQQGKQWALKLGHAELTEWLLDRGMTLHERLDQNPLMHEAAANGHVSVLSLLLARRADVHARRSHAAQGQPDLQEQPLHVAANTGHVKAVSWLLKKRADAGATLADGKKPLTVACESGHVDVVSSLLQAKASHVQLSSNELMAAASGGHVEVLTFLRSKGVSLRSRGLEGERAEHIAALQGRTAALTWLLDGGGDIAARDGEGSHPLHLACMAGHSSAASLLLERRADVQAKDSTGASPLSFACGNGNPQVVKLLVKRKANVHATDANSQSALHYAAMGGHVKVLAALSKVVSKSAPMDEGRAKELLQVASQSGHARVVKWLKGRQEL